MMGEDAPALTPENDTTASLALDPAHVAALLELSADAILTVSPDERITSWNHGAEAMFGYTAREVIGRSFQILLPDEERDRGELEWIHATTLREGSIRDHETRRRRKDGSVVDVSLTRTAVRDEFGTLIGFTAILRDITWRKRLERELLAAERLKTAGTVAAGVAHEIGAPLMAISMTLERAMRRRCGECEGAGEMRLAQEQTERIARLARQLVNLARPPSPQRAPTSINDTITAAASLVRATLARRDVRIVLDLAPDPPLIHADGPQLQQVILNLLLNACNAMCVQGGEVRVVTTWGEAELSVVVVDNGPGIAADLLPHIFTPFFSTTGGSGLGLALAAQIVQAHGGTLRAESERGAGSRFTITLPRRQ